MPTNTAPTFAPGDDGIVTTNFNSRNDGAQSIALQADGKIVVGGVLLGPNTELRFAVARYNADGSLDTSFDGDGKLSSNFDASGTSVAVQADGKILVAGRERVLGGPSDSVLLRYNADGSLDTSFSGDGKANTNFGGSLEGDYSVTLQADGKILVAGGGGLARYNTDGTLDSAFDGDGTVATFIVGGTRSVVVQPDGRIVVAGWVPNAGYDDFAIARFNADGSPDTDFGNSGRVDLPLGQYDDRAHGVELQADGKIVVAGFVRGADTNGEDFAVVRLNTDGSLDSTFDGDGKLTTDFGIEDDQAAGVRIQADGKIVVAGSRDGPSGNREFALARYNADGSLDTSFDADGEVITHIGQSANGNAIALQSDGRILVAGNVRPNTNIFSSQTDFALARYNADGSLDTTFDGTTLNGTPGYTEGGTPVVLDSDVQVIDAELLSVQGHYAGATLTLERHSGANAQDVYSATGALGTLSQGGALTHAGTSVGTVTTNSGGTLVLTFNSNATQGRVDGVLGSIAYSNSSATPPASVQIDWIFSDGNTGLQGPGGALSATGSTTVMITAVDPSVAAKNDAFQITENVVLGGGANVFNNNGSGADGESTVTAVNGVAANVGVQLTLASGALVKLDANGTLAYNPNHAFDALPGPASGASNLTATDTFTYTLVGGSTATVTVTVTGVDSNDTLQGTTGNDTLNGGAGADTMRGGQGNDTYFVDNWQDHAEEGAGEGTDTLITTIAYQLEANAENLIYAGTGSFLGVGNELANVITGGAGNDQLYGWGGDDTLNGGAGADYMRGWQGNDTYHIDNWQDHAEEGVGEGTDTLITTIAYQLEANAENLTYAGTGAFLGVGNELANIITGGAGNDQLYGWGGDDTLNGGAGADWMRGWQGNDTYCIDNWQDHAEEGVGEGTDTLITTIAYQLEANAENLTYAGTGSFLGVGNELANTITGGAGNDALYGWGGDDTLNGGAGADWMRGWQGNDTYYIDNWQDHAEEDIGEGTDTLITTIAYQLEANAENLTYAGTGAFLGVGNELANTITGGADNDQLYGWGGDDTLNGGAGADWMRGWQGNDTYYIDNWQDHAEEGIGEGIDTLITTIDYQLESNTENLTYTGTGAFLGVGNELENAITGGAGNDELYGWDGDDTLVGRGGADRLHGGAGDDTFDYNQIDEGLDTIADFTGGDRLDIHDVLVGYGAGSDINDFVQLSAGASTTISVNADGTGADFVALATLENVALIGSLLNDWVANGNLVL